MSPIPYRRFLDRTTPPSTFTLTALAGLSALSMNLFLPSLPAMTAHFNTPYHVMQLSVTLYMAATAVLQIVIGPLADRYGRRPVLLWSLVVFTIGAAGSALAPTVEVFLGFRMLQAAIATAMVLSRAVVRDMVPGDAAASMIAYVTMGMSLVPMLGPAVGGVIGGVFGWEGNFALMAALGIALWALTWADLGETAPPGAGSLIAQIRQYPELLGAPRFWGYALAVMFASGAFYAYLGGAPFVGSEIHGLSPEALGLFFGTAALGFLFGNGIAGRWSARIGMNRMALAGAVVSTAGLGLSWLLHVLGFGGVHVFFGFTTLLGLGNGMLMPNGNAGMLSVRPHLAGSASGLGGALMLAGGAALSAYAGTLLSVETGATPLLALMTGLSALSIVAILYVMRRDRRLGLQNA